MKKIILCLLCVLCLCGLVGCAQKQKPADIIASGGQVKIGIIKYVTAPALDSAQEGIIEALEKAGYKDGEKIKIVKYSPEGDPSTLSQVSEIAVKECDLVFAIATPTVSEVKAKIKKTGLDVPVLFTAVTDPVAKGIVDSLEKTGCNISGTSDLNPVADQLALITDLAPEAKKVGFLYTSSEDNSVVQLNLLKAKAAELNLEVVTRAITNLSELKMATEALVGEGIDVIYLPTDNLVNSAAKTVLDITNKNKIPSICAEEGYLSNGGTITLSINYKDLGKLTGEMAVKILNGEVEDASSLPVGNLTKFELKVNEEEANKYGIIISDAIKEKLNK